MGKPNSKLILYVDDQGCQSFHVNDVLGYFADFVREDKNSSLDKLEVNFFFVKVGYLFGTTLNPRGQLLKLWCTICVYLPNIVMKSR